MTQPFHEEHDLDEVTFRRRQRAKARRAPLASKPETVEEMATTYGLSTAAANFALACYDFPPELRPLLDAIVGECGDRHGEWFPANDEKIGKHANRSAKWVQRWRPELRAWQKSKNIALIDINGHEYKPGQTPKPHEYRVNFSRQVAAVLLEGEKMSEWSFNQMEALEESAANVRDSEYLPKKPTDNQRTRKPRRDTETLINRKLSTAATLIKRALQLHTSSGKAAEINLETVAALELQLAELRRAAEGQVGAVSNKEPKERRVDTRQPDEPAGAESGAWFGTTEGGSGQNVHNPPLEADGSTGYGEFIPDFDVSEWVFVDADGAVVVRYPPPSRSSPQIDAAIQAEGQRLERMTRERGGEV